jgi:hypothetical protein
MVLNEEEKFDMEEQEQEHHHYGYNDGTTGIQVHYKEHDDDSYNKALFDITPTNQVDLNEKEEDEEMTDSSSYYYYHPQQDLLALDCADYCSSATRPVVDVDGDDFRSLFTSCLGLG